MNKISNFIMLSLVLLTYFSCTKAIIDEGRVIPPTDEIVKFNPDIETITFNHCITCHGGAAPAADLSLVEYQDVRFVTESGNLLERINDETNAMPPSGLLPPEQRALIEKWVEDGYLEN